MPDDQETTYTPDTVRYFILHWRQLVEMSQGTSNGMLANSTGGSSGRVTFACLIADLTQAADTLPIYWQATEFIFKRQLRQATLSHARQTTPPVPIHERLFESSIPSEALDDACVRMAEHLGYVEPLPHVA